MGRVKQGNSKVRFRLKRLLLTVTIVACDMEREKTGAWKMERRGVIIMVHCRFPSIFLYPFCYLSLTRTLCSGEEDMSITVFEYGICSLKIA